MQIKGKITSWNDDRGFGFITPDNGGKPIFIHVKEFQRNRRRPELDLTVMYTVSTDRHGRACATNALLAGSERKSFKKKGNNPLPVFVAATFLIAVTVSVLVEEMPPVILGMYAVSSWLTYRLYAKDKSAAQSGSWRTSESTLHLFSIAGGWPGALIAQNRLRHKSQKVAFRRIYWVTVLLNCGAFMWLLTPRGAAAINSLMKNISG